MSNPIEQFRQAIAAAGLTPPDEIIADGAIHRYSTNGRRGDDSGWYVFHADGIASGAFGCWRTGLQSTWCSKSDSDMTPAEVQAHRQRIKAMQAQREAEQVQRNEAAAVEAEQLLSASKPCTEIAYLSAKGVMAYGVRQDGHTPFIPMRDTAGKLWNVERINPYDFKDKRGGELVGVGPRRVGRIGQADLLEQLDGGSASRGRRGGRSRVRC